LEKWGNEGLDLFQIESSRFIKTGGGKTWGGPKIGKVEKNNTTLILGKKKLVK